MTSIIFKAKDGRIGVKTIYNANSDFLEQEMKSSDDVTNSMCWNRGERKWDRGKGDYVYKKRYYWSKDIIGVYHFSKYHCGDYPKAMKVMYQEVKKYWDGDTKDKGNLLKDKERESQERKKELIQEIKYKKEEILKLQNEMSKM